MLHAGHHPIQVSESALPWLLPSLGSDILLLDTSSTCFFPALAAVTAAFEVLGDGDQVGGGPGAPKLPEQHPSDAAAPFPSPWSQRQLAQHLSCLAESRVEVSTLIITRQRISVPCDSGNM